MNPKPIGDTGGEQRLIPWAEVLVFLLVGVGIELVQGAVLPGFLRFQAILVFVLYSGWHSDPVRGAVVGTGFGLFEDYIFGLPLGMNGLSKCLLGFTASYLSRWSAPDIGLLRGAMVAALAVLDRLIVLGMMWLLGQQTSPVTFPVLLSAAAVSGILGEVFFRLYDKIRFPPKDFRRF